MKNAAFAERLRKAMKMAGYKVKPSALEALFNSSYFGNPVTFQAASSWLRGASMPTQEKLEVIAKALRQDAHFLRFGFHKKTNEDLLAYAKKLNPAVMSGSNAEVKPS